MNIDYLKPLTRRFIEKNRNKINWLEVSINQKLSESFIDKFKHKLNWYHISQCQVLSEAFIEKHQDKVDWDNISVHQKLSEPFIEKFKDKIYWDYISSCQVLSESFIHKYRYKVDWIRISLYQKLSERFIKSHREEVCSTLIPNRTDRRKLSAKMKDMQDYAKRFGLKIKGNYIYAYRQHDKWGRGMFNRTIIYDKPGVYRDWRCNLNGYCENSYGLGIFPKGNVLVRVHVKNWGVWAKNTRKARVWAFELLEPKGQCDDN